ncbi:molybdopterin-dependent oxidoreductase [Variovorax sp. HJSM1_2]|uniref:molybdopterin-dependent oxidoreductase n=1 Tax=Variovorax sp. HJSM1_2 TaxID=3366263 RepID=UPI003BD75F4A
MATRGFGATRRGGLSATLGARLPRGQSLTDDFPVLSAGPTPHVEVANWKFTLKVGPRPVKVWNWAEFNALPQTRVVADIHCVTTWSKFDTGWQGVTVDDLLAAAGFAGAPTPFSLAHAYDDYSTNVDSADMLGGKAMVATHYDGAPLQAEHGGPARLLVPHLYFWKSAKWVSGLQFLQREELGFWELRGYHRRGDPFLQQRYSDD